MPDLFRILTLIAALVITVIGALLGIAGLAAGAMGGGADTLAMVTASASILVLSTGLGAASAWHAWRAIRGYRSAAFRPGRIWPLLVLFAITLVLGQMMLSLSSAPPLAFPLAHMGAAIFPAIIILALVGRAIEGTTTWRHMTLQAASGAFLAAPLGMIVETLSFVLIGLAALTGLAWQPHSQDLILRASSYLEDPYWLQEPEALFVTMLTPAVIAVAVAVVAGLIPLVEEAIKTIGVALIAYRRPSMPQYFLWGIAAGAGFATVEGLLNTSGALEAWLPTVLLRIGTTLLHCLTGALMGLAWYQLITRQSWSRGLALYALSIAIHGLWNGVAISMTLASLRALSTDLTSSRQGLAGLGLLAMLLLQSALAFCLAGGLAGLTIYVRRRSDSAALAGAQAPHAAAGTFAPEAGDSEE